MGLMVHGREPERVAEHFLPSAAWGGVVGRIEVVESYAGPEFEGRLDAETHLPVGWEPA